MGESSKIPDSTMNLFARIWNRNFGFVVAIWRAVFLMRLRFFWLWYLVCLLVVLSLFWLFACVQKRRRWIVAQSSVSKEEGNLGLYVGDVVMKKGEALPEYPGAILPGTRRRGMLICFLFSL